MDGLCHHHRCPSVNSPFLSWRKSRAEVGDLIWGFVCFFDVTVGWGEASNATVHENKILEVNSSFS